jgi:hypothetical protein
LAGIRGQAGRQALANTISAIRRRNSSAVEANFVIPWKVARSKRQCTGGEFVTKYIAGVVSILDIRNLKFQIDNISNSCHISERCTSETSNSIEIMLQNDFKNCLASVWPSLSPQLLMVIAVDSVCTSCFRRYNYERRMLDLALKATTLA